VEKSLRIMNMVRRRILENPAVTNEELFEAAVQLEPSVRDLNLRQFNARYPLQVRRWELSQPKPTYRMPAAMTESPAGTEAEVDGGHAPPVEAATPATAAAPPAAVEPAFAQEPEFPEQTAVAAEPSPAPAPAPQRRRQAAARRKPRSRVVAEPAAAVVDEAARREVRLKLMRFAESIARAGTIPDAIRSLAALDDVVDEIVATLRPA
jgi:hypothetical protein